MLWCVIMLVLLAMASPAAMTVLALAAVMMKGTSRVDE